jgi:MFS family permease
MAHAESAGLGDSQLGHGVPPEEPLLVGFGPVDAEAAHGLIAARIDRIPLGPTQYLLASIMQIAWGLVVALDLVFARIYPFIWGPNHDVSSFQFDVLLVFNTGVGILIGEYGLGLVADRIGRKPVLIISALLAGGFIWEIAFSNSFASLMVWNTLYALGVGGTLSVCNVYMHEIAPLPKRGQLALRTQLIALLLSAVAGSVPAYFWIPAQYQRVLFLDAILPVAILIPLVVFLVPESPRWLASRGLFAKADAIVRKWEKRAAKRSGPLPEPHAVEAKVTPKVSWRELFRGVYGRRTTLLAAIWFLAYGGMVYAFSSFAPLYLVATDHFTAHEVFASTLAVGVAAAVVFLLVSYLGERVERKVLVIAGCTLFIVGGIPLAFVHAFVGAFLLYLLMSIGLYLFFMNLYSYTALSFPTRLRSAGTGWTDGIGHCGSALSPLVAGPLFTATALAGNYGWFLYILIPGCFAPALLLAVFGKRQSGRALEALAD